MPIVARRLYQPVTTKSGFAPARRPLPRPLQRQARFATDDEDACSDDDRGGEEGGAGGDLGNPCCRTRA